MNQVHFRRDVRQIERLFHCGIAAADNRDFLVAVKETVAGGAGGNPFAFKRLFGRQAQIARRSAGRNNQRVSGVFGAVASETERTVLQIDGVNMVENDFRVEFLGMLMHALHQRGTSEIVRVAGPVLYLGGGGQLTAFFEAGDQHRIQVSASSIDRCGITRRA